MKKIPYKSLAEDRATGEFTVKKSRFIGDLFLVHDEEEATEALKIVQQEHRDATHICYAYILNEDVEKMKSSDNGEPQGTAGAPILNALQKNELTNVLATVTRYFGGIKLGAGGLIRAYGKGVTVAIEEANLAIYDFFTVAQIKVSYSDHDAVKYFLKQNEIPILDEQFSEVVTLQIQLKKSEADNFNNQLANRFNGRYALTVIAERILPTLIS
ncbi:YigZ family protein [Xylocopilactobacillus apis]|uniref:YigZ family protein n=1 Tax=Xylocopilactobacillus apis TaxID=2932183 RepID=A0AAU9CWZ7_9LACO|nr:YigZ family protein [Xylocopilactobacillus apis]BDR55884.1 YigZ family protein [Xylocopilactobacillus apis]